MKSLELSTISRDLVQQVFVSCCFHHGFILKCQKIAKNTTKPKEMSHIASFYLKNSPKSKDTVNSSWFLLSAGTFIPINPVSCFLFPVSFLSVSVLLPAGLFVSAVSPAVQNSRPHSGPAWRQHSGHWLWYSSNQILQHYYCRYNGDLSNKNGWKQRLMWRVWLVVTNLQRILTTSAAPLDSAQRFNIFQLILLVWGPQLYCFWSLWQIS